VRCRKSKAAVTLHSYFLAVYRAMVVHYRARPAPDMGRSLGPWESRNQLADSTQLLQQRYEEMLLPVFCMREARCSAEEGTQLLPECLESLAPHEDSGVWESQTQLQALLDLPGGLSTSQLLPPLNLAGAEGCSPEAAVIAELFHMHLLPRFTKLLQSGQSLLLEEPLFHDDHAIAASSELQHTWADINALCKPAAVVHEDDTSTVQLVRRSVRGSHPQLHDHQTDTCVGNLQLFRRHKHSCQARPPCLWTACQSTASLAASSPDAPPLALPAGRATC
jgi:hypothetical protein